MSEPRIIKQLDPYEIETRIKAQKEAEAARETARLAALPVKEYDPMPGPEEIPKITKALDPYEIETLVKAEREAEAKREAAKDTSDYPDKRNPSSRPGS